MKSIIFTLLMSLVFLTTRAQNIPPYAGETIDSVAYRISYETQSVSNPAMKDSSGHYIYSTDIMRLDIGRSKSCFYSYTNYLRDSLRYLTYSQGMKFKRANAPRGAITWKVYQNYPKGMTTVTDAIYHVFYKINEEMAEPQWHVIADSSTTILGYNCTLATTHYKGRDWRVWFTEDIPLDFGPWKLRGLPGLILQASDQTNQYVFKAIGLQHADGSELITLPQDLNHYEKVSQKEFDKAKSEMSFFEAAEMSGVKMGLNPNHIDDSETLKLFHKVLPYNPIEISE